MGKQSIYEEFIRNRKRYPRIPDSFMADSVDGKGEFFAFALGKRVKSQDRLPQFYSAMTHLLNPCGVLDRTASKPLETIRGTIV